MGTQVRVYHTLNMLRAKHQTSSSLTPRVVEHPSLFDSVDSFKPRSGVLDTRPYQELEPLHLPSKLKDRISKAQRRAAAEKDGVSIFTTNGASSLLLGDEKEPATASPRSRTNDTPVVGRSRSQRRREAQIAGSGEGVTQSAQIKEKIHLPDVILGHKMREFEAKMNLNALFVDPLENNLHHLSIEEKERVMLRMQEKIQAIMTEVDAHFVQIKDELDAHGVFDTAANYQRAQALCLVELQRRCKLEKLRDDAMREVLDENGSITQTAMSQMEGKLNELLAKHQRRSEDVRNHEAELAFSHLQKSTKSFALKRRPVVTKRNLSPVRKMPQVKESNQLDHESVNKASKTRNESPNTITNMASSTATESVAVEDWATRHPHIAQVLQILTSNGGSPPPPSAPIDALDDFSAISGESNRAVSGSKLLNLAEEWHERSESYKIIALRTIDELQRRFTRWRWDSTRRSHGSSSTPLSETEIKLSPTFLQRLYSQRNTASARLKEEEERSRRLQDQETNADRRKKADDVYQQLQVQIQAKRHARDARLVGAGIKPGTTFTMQTPSSATLTSHAEAKRTVTAESALAGKIKNGSCAPSAPLPQPRPDKTVALSKTRGSELCLDSETDVKAGSLSASLSAPVLTTISSLADLRERLLTRNGSRRTFRDRKLPSLSTQQSRRSRVRGDSLIGAPISTDLCTLGHFSNARIEERRASAQTWAWYHPQAKICSTETHSLAEEDEDDQSDIDDSERRDAIDFKEDVEGNDDYGDNDLDSSIDDGGSEDDGKSIHSSVSSRHAIGSARSSYSALSRKAGFHGMEDKGHRHGGQKKYNKFPKRGSPRRARSKSPSKHVNSAVRGPRGSRLLSRPSNSSNVSGSSGGMFAGIHFTANAQVLQHHLEEVWRALDFPFSAKLVMLEKYASLQDGDALSQALIHWESAVEIVLMREKLKHILAEYEKLSDLRPSSRLTPAEWSYLLMQQIELPVNAINLSSEELVRWTQDNMDVITQRCEKMAQQLKAKTGDELCFQGHRYPPRV